MPSQTVHAIASKFTLRARGGIDYGELDSSQENAGDRLLRLTARKLREPSAGSAMNSSKIAALLRHVRTLKLMEFVNSYAPGSATATIAAADETSQGWWAERRQVSRRCFFCFSLPASCCGQRRLFK